MAKDNSMALTAMRHYAKYGDSLRGWSDLQEAATQEANSAQAGSLHIIDSFGLLAKTLTGLEQIAPEKLIKNLLPHITHSMQALDAGKHTLELAATHRMISWGAHLVAAEQRISGQSLAWQGTPLGTHVAYHAGKMVSAVDFYLVSKTFEMVDGIKDTSAAQIISEHASSLLSDQLITEREELKRHEGNIPGFAALKEVLATHFPERPRHALNMVGAMLADPDAVVRSALSGLRGKNPDQKPTP